MAHKYGNQINGIRTLEDLRQRCRIDGDCWIWGLGLSQGKPSVIITGDNGKGHSQSGRRASVLLSGETIKPGYVVWQSPKCFEHLCVNPAHSQIGTLSGLRCEHERRKGWSKKAIHAKAGARLVALNSKITAEQAAEIRVSILTRKKISEKYGICLSQVYYIRNWTYWRGPAAAVNSSVFSWRGAA